MPIYQYRCADCGQTTESFVRSFSDGERPICPNCGSRHLEKLLSTPNVLKGETRAPGSTCCGRAERCDTPPCSTDESCWRG